MNFLKNLFGGGSGGNASDRGIYVYVRPRGCEEVIRVRLDPNNDLSRNPDGGFFVRKMARGNYRCFNPVEMQLTFNGNHEIVENEVSGGDLVDEAAYLAWQEELAAKKQAAAEQNAAVDAANSETEA